MSGQYNGTDGHRVHAVLKLYVAASAPNSLRARANLEAIANVIASGPREHPSTSRSWDSIGRIPRSLPLLACGAAQTAAGSVDVCAARSEGPLDRVQVDSGAESGFTPATTPSLTVTVSEVAVTALSGAHLLVTGATGFIGARLCRRAVEQGGLVHAVSRRPHADESKRLRWNQVDLSDYASTQALLRRVQPDIVLHLASEVAGARDRSHVLPMLHANLVAAVNVMQASADSQCGRVVLAGSMEEPDFSDREAMPQSPYAMAKWAAGGYARMFHALYGLPVVHLRIFMVYGPGQSDLRKLVPYVTLSLLRDRPPELTAGTRGVDWIYIDDVVDAFLAAAVAPDIEGTSLDIGSGDLVTIRSLVARLCSLVGSDVEPIFGARPDRQLERTRVASQATATSTLDWRPRVPLDEGLERTVEFYRAHLSTCRRLARFPNHSPGPHGTSRE